MISNALLFAFALFAASETAAADDGLVRLPGQGQVKSEEQRATARADRLIPGGGLMLSFDANRDGRVTADEVEAGQAAAFLAADANGDGSLSPIEQARWSDNLPTYDPSLANPARFDPNLDRVVTAEEFAFVVRNFANSLADPASGDVVLASLKAQDRRPRDEEEGEADQDEPPFGRRPPPGRAPPGAR
ncbi:MAG: hypothetical protein AAFX03_10305 [Pseudomonadota bacterium]